MVTQMLTYYKKQQTFIITDVLGYLGGLFSDYASYTAVENFNNMNVQRHHKYSMFAKCSSWHTEQ